MSQYPPEYKEIPPQQGYPPPQQGYPPPQQGYPPPQQGYPPPQQGYPPQQQYGYPPQQYPPQMMPPMQQSQTSTNVVVVGNQAPAQTIIVERNKVNHLLHCIITLFFFPWIIVWICLCICN